MERILCQEIICKGNAFLDFSKSGRLYFATNNQFGFVDHINQPNGGYSYANRNMPDEEDSEDITGLACLNETIYTFGKSYY